MNNEIILKNCPYCGGSARLGRNYSNKRRSYFVFCLCNICGAESKAFPADDDPAIDEWDTEECRQAAAAWNMRVNSENERT